MFRLFLAAALLAAPACAPLPREELPGYSGKLRLDQGGGEDQESNRFARQITTRYGEKPGAEAVKLDLAKQGFICRDPPPVEARGDYLLSRCDLTRSQRDCMVTWSVSLRFAENSGALDAIRVRPEGLYFKHCRGS